MPFDILDVVHSHEYLAVIVLRDVVVLWGGGEDLSGHKEAGTDIPVIGELIIDGKTEGAACAVSGYGIDGREVRAAKNSELQ